MLRERPAPASKAPVYASFPLRAFSVDACIPCLCIAHAFMGHNRASRTMFRYRSLRILLLAAILPIFCVPARASRSRLNSRQSTSAASAVAPTKTGIDVLEEQNFALLRGKRVGLITNQTGVDSRGRRTVDVLAHASDFQLAVLFSPEHGFGGRANTTIADSTDAATGLPIYSLYGDVRRPTEAMLASIDRKSTRLNSSHRCISYA